MQTVCLEYSSPLMSIAETEELQLIYLDFTANYYRNLGSLNRRPLPISTGTVRTLRGKLFEQILRKEVSEGYAEAAQQILSTSAKALERKKVTAEGRAAIKAEEAQELALNRQGFKFWPDCGDFVKVLGRARKHRLHLFLNEDGQPTAILNYSSGVLDFDRELGRWPLLNIGADLARVVTEADSRVAGLLV